MGKILLPTGMDSNGQFCIAQIGDALADLLAISGTPLVTVNPTVAGSGATATVQGNNSNGIITLNSGTTITTGGLVLTFKLGNGMAFPNKLLPLFNAYNLPFANLINNLFVTPIDGATAGLYVNGLNLTAGTSYVGSFKIGGW